jgi:branched-chain amino acid transport system ATP-binding protein
MLLIARALLSRPALMLVDEITEGLQPSVIERVGIALRRERDRRGTTMLLVEQNVGFALAVADRYAVLKRGAIVIEGAAGDAGAAEAIRAQLRV